jgi:uncharacterized membrane protein
MSGTPPDRGAAGTSTGLDSRVASVVAYSAWWVTGVMLLAVERSDATVRFHAAQSVIVFGLASVVIGVAYAAVLPLWLVSGDAVRVLVAVVNTTWLAAAGLWAWLIFKAARGERWCVPGLEPLVTALAGRRPAPTHQH